MYLKVDKRDEHQLRWELSVRRDEITQLQKQLSEASAHLTQDRRQLESLQQENEDLRMGLRKAEHYSEHLAAIAKPRLEETSFSALTMPKKIGRHPGGASSHTSESTTRFAKKGGGGVKLAEKKQPASHITTLARRHVPTNEFEKK